jgi:predicted transglutaminase-like cysteine proteinase
MSIGKARHIAQALSLASALAVAGLPCTAAAGQPDTDLLAVAPAPPSDKRTAEPPLGSHPSIQPAVGTQEPFGFRPAEGPASFTHKWRAVVGAIEIETGLLRQCRIEPDGCPPDTARFLAIIDAAQARQGRARLGEVNRAVNLAIRYRSDAARHGTPDAWASPLATLATGEGDCEDYAIAKYVALREAGVPPGDLRLVVVRDARLEQDHAVLAARFEERWLVLDNRRFLLLDDRDVRDYRPLASFGPDAGPVQLVADRAEGRPEAASGTTAAGSEADPS